MRSQLVGHQNKTTDIQTSPRDPRPTGITTATQMSHKMASQAGGTQTTPPTSPKKSPLTGGMQTSPPKDNSCEQGRPGSTRMHLRQRRSTDKKYIKQKER